MSGRLLNDTLIAVSILSGLMAAIIGFIKLKKQPLPTKIIICLVIYAAINDLISTVLAKGFGINNLWLINIYEYVLGICGIFFFYFSDKGFFKTLKPIAILFSLTYGVLWYRNELINPGGLNGNAMVYEAFLLIIISIMFFYRLYVKEENIFIEKSSPFLITVGVIFYFSGALFSFLLWAEMLAQKPNDLYHSWVLHNISNVIKNILFSVAFLKINVHK